MSKTKIWYAKDGRDLQVRQMETTHIHHCIRLIEKAWPLWRARYRIVFYRELKRRDDTNLSR